MVVVTSGPAADGQDCTAWSPADLRCGAGSENCPCAECGGYNCDCQKDVELDRSNSASETDNRKPEEDEDHDVGDEWSHEGVHVLILAEVISSETALTVLHGAAFNAAD